MHIFIIGSKGIPARYGGFETFVEKLTGLRKDDRIQYHVSCLGDREDEFYYNGARCFQVKAANIGSAKAILYDFQSLVKCYRYIKRHKLTEAAVYILACRIGPLLALYKRRFARLGVRIYVNPDGHEWKRSKWSGPVRRYWKFSERWMVKHADLLICDSVGIEHYIQSEYRRYRPNTTFISYGADTHPSALSDVSPDFVEWMSRHRLTPGGYYLIVGRFVPENNYELMIREFMASSTDRDLVIITNAEESEFYTGLLQRTRFDRDSRIRFVGTVYNQELLKKIREQAYGYLHGHEVGGTNPSLLEALAATRTNLLLDVIFNREVGADGALYFDKQPGSLSRLIGIADRLSEAEIAGLQGNAFRRITEHYSWEGIVSRYESRFLGTGELEIGQDQPINGKEAVNA